MVNNVVVCMSASGILWSLIQQIRPIISPNSLSLLLWYVQTHRHECCGTQNVLLNTATCWDLILHWLTHKYSTQSVRIQDKQQTVKELTCCPWPTCHTRCQTAISPAPHWFPDMWSPTPASAPCTQRATLQHKEQYKIKATSKHWEEDIHWVYLWVEIPHRSGSSSVWGRR